MVVVIIIIIIMLLQLSVHPVAVDLTLSSRSYEKGGTAKTSAEGQGQPWALEPVMMMIMKKTNVKD
jgi:hypothetical protein